MAEGTLPMVPAPARALCDAMGWDSYPGRTSEGFPHGGQLAIEVLDELRQAGWQLVPIEASAPEDLGVIFRDWRTNRPLPGARGRSK
ncbi:hypothetical protein [Microbacterium rhizomatis]|uniref:Uncharacterized protein n=1 Tax=Microbacterium rhizomatis TaxID=1631477 RepID=A0A5J5IYI7_9MICO|nr:hypothetical protein [Microbacterium rhizomatis]KAA9104997.1 hypothetical protein F6B43_18285 [Microbacterium rhizomatis]